MLTLDEAIEHCKEVAQENNDVAEGFFRVFQGYAEDEYVECKNCASNHLQLAGWLEELKERREKDEIYSNT